jgi:hypothetical protein
MGARFSLDQLGSDPDAGANSADASFEDIVDPEFLSDLPDIDLTPLVGKNGITGDYQEVLEMRELGDQVLGEPICDILLRWIAPEIGKGEYGN